MPPPPPPGDCCSVLVEGACLQSGWWRWTQVAFEVEQCGWRAAPTAPQRTGPRQPSPPMRGRASCGDGTEAVESSPGIHLPQKHYISQTKQQNLIRCEVVVVQEVEIAPVRDGPDWEHHDLCEHNHLCQWQKLNWIRLVEPHYFRIFATTLQYFCNFILHFCTEAQLTQLTRGPRNRKITKSLDYEKCPETGKLQNPLITESVQKRENYKIFLHWGSTDPTNMGPQKQENNKIPWLRKVSRKTWLTRGPNWPFRCLDGWTTLF